ncbi:MAG: PEP/pyruvate-binding domain-containing protein [Clostridia bacterium]|nr:PEP/pyruvate-binding domain-containing protein [Clostridia bacterium]
MVWQVSTLHDYSFFVKPFVDKAVREGRNIVYMRFGEHEPLLSPREGLKIYQLDAHSGFESFTVKVNEIISSEGRKAFYVFDCLSGLQTVWSADLMMGNFFRVTCPYLFELDTVAFFGILRNRHSYETIARIRETTQLLIDVFGSEGEMYVHPIKVWKRYSQTMFLPHKFDSENQALIPLTDGISASKFYAHMAQQGMEHSDQFLDSWDRFFIRAKMEHDAGLSDQTQTLAKLGRMLFGREPHLADLVRDHFKLTDYLQIKQRMIGSGSIGGKATGMLLARKILQNNAPELYARLEPHDSFYIGSDVFYTYLVQNGWWKLRIEQRTPEGYFSTARELKEKLLSGTFPDSIRDQFHRILESFGQNPIIVRSSSLLEDSFGNAFAGKYESIFCVNSGSPEERFADFENAVRQVYASAMDESALAYRKQRGLDQSDEQMAILVQRVSGSRFDDVFMPCAAGVGYSYNSYVWNQDIDPQAGLVRLVLGLGTRAVDRTDGDYPRVASLDKPDLRPLSDRVEKSRFSQRYADTLNLSENRLKISSLDELSKKLPQWFKSFMLEHDREAESRLRERDIYRDVLYTTCEGLLNKAELLDYLRKTLKVIEQHYQYPVDIEFTINFSEQGDFAVNLLQCRPLQTRGLGLKVKMPKGTPASTLFSMIGSTMGGSIFQPLDTVVLVDPRAYYLCPMNTKYRVARAIGKINELLRHTERNVMLMGPGRWGTSSPELGVPVRFAEISTIKALCEVSYEGAGYMPELSFGSHFFQDLVETGVFYAAIFENDEKVTYRPELLEKCPNRFVEMLPDEAELIDIIKVYETGSKHLTLLSDTLSQKTLCIFKEIL